MVSDVRLTRRAFLGAVPASIAAWRALALAPAQAGGARWDEVERICERFVAARRAPGLSLAVSRNGAIAFARGWGLSNREQGEPVTPQTLFRIASVTKTFIGALFLVLARTDALSLDDRASRWLPGFPRSGDFTLRMLLNHTSGLGEYTRRPYDDLVRDARRDYSSDELVAYMAAIRPLFAHEPGAARTYSNTGYVLLGVIAQRAGGAPLPALIERHLVAPAGLAETAWDSDPDRAQGRAIGYGFRHGGWVRAPSVSTSYIGASGAIRSTARDLCKWCDALFGGKVLTREELSAMMTPATLTGGGSTLTRGGSGYGLGLWTGTARGRRVAWHSGSTAGFAADARHYPDDRVSIVMLGNADASRMGSAPPRIREAVLNLVTAT
jgi:CubicO group peptidase (beta-lactamase class C family)